MAGRAAVIWTPGWGSSRLAQSHGCLLEASVPYHGDLSMEPLECSNDKALGLSQSKRCERQSVYHICASASEVSHHQFCHILCIKNKSLRPAHTQEYGNWAPPVEGRTPNYMCIYFKTTTLLYYWAFIFITPHLFFLNPGWPWGFHMRSECFRPLVFIVGYITVEGGL